MSGVTCTAEGQNVYLWKNRDGSFEYVRKVGALKGEAKQVGIGYQYTYNVTTSNGMLQSVTDNHWITGGGGGGDGTWESPRAGNNGICWCGGKGADTSYCTGGLRAVG